MMQFMQKNVLTHRNQPDVDVRVMDCRDLKALLSPGSLFSSHTVKHGNVNGVLKWAEIDKEG